MNSDFKGIMRPGQKNRGRGGRNNNMSGGQGYSNNRGPRPPHRSQNFDSSGPSVKIRGNAYQVFERYIAMAREAASAGDRVSAENLYQHAEHYYRIMQANGGEGQGNPMGQQRPMTPADNEMSGQDDGDGQGGQQQPYQQQQSYQQQPPQYGNQQPPQQHQPQQGGNYNQGGNHHQGGGHQQQHQPQQPQQHQPQPRAPQNDDLGLPPSILNPSRPSEG